MKVKVCCKYNYEVLEDDGEQYGWRHDRQFNHEFDAYQEESKKGGYYDTECTEELDVKLGDTVYAVYALYSTGCTFSRTDGCVSVQGLFKTYEEAVELVKILEKAEDDDYQYPWVGYFERLDEIDIVPLIVRY